MEATADWPAGGAAAAITNFLVQGHHPFDYDGPIDLDDEREQLRIVRRVQQAEPGWPPETWGALPEARDFIAGFLRVDPRERATAAAGLRHSWILKSEAALRQAYEARVVACASR